jgi:ABC-type lipoprotein export system ATPase subunit
VAEAFGLGVDDSQRHVIYDNVEVKIGPRDIVYITGESGSGKSVLLRALEKDLGEQAVNIASVKLDRNKPLIDCVGKTVEEGLELLSRVGLNDAFLFVRRYSQLSDGQKYRYRIAKLVESEKQFWVMDEFCATLDRDTAKIVDYNLQKLARQEGKAVLAATTHTDLFEDLKPSVHIHKRFGKEIEVKYYPNEINKECSLVREMRVIEGTRQDYYQLAGFHYRSHKIAGIRKIFCLKRDEELCGVIVYCYPPAACFGRRIVLPRMSMRELNQKLSIISRVVVHPKYRTIGLGHKLVHETLSSAGTPYVEMVAVMAKYNPFAEHAEMQKIAESPPVKSAFNVADVLKTLGFNLTFLRSQKYVLKKLASLNGRELSMLKEVFAENRHPRFMKEFSFHDPYGKSKIYKEAVENADLEKLTKLIGICAMLLQTKVYLFWQAAA